MRLRVSSAFAAGGRPGLRLTLDGLAKVCHHRRDAASHVSWNVAELAGPVVVKHFDQFSTRVDHKWFAVKYQLANRQCDQHQYVVRFGLP